MRRGLGCTHAGARGGQPDAEPGQVTLHPHRRGAMLRDHSDCLLTLPCHPPGSTQPLLPCHRPGIPGPGPEPLAPCECGWRRRLHAPSPPPHGPGHPERQVCVQGLRGGGVHSQRAAGRQGDGGERLAIDSGMLIMDSSTIGIVNVQLVGRVMGVSGLSLTVL